MPNCENFYRGGLLKNDNHGDLDIFNKPSPKVPLIISPARFCETKVKFLAHIKLMHPK